MKHVLINRKWILFEGFCKYPVIAFRWFNIYAPQSSAPKVSLWQDLESFLEKDKDIPTVLIGDFNSVFGECEKENCIYIQSDCNNFSKFVSDNDLISVQMSNSLFTWSGPQNKRSRLDRALINLAWDKLGFWISISLRRNNFDHKPLVLR